MKPEMPRLPSVVPHAFLALSLAALAAACRSPDPLALLEVSDVETYWAVDASSGAEQYIAPVVRFKVHGKGGQEMRSVQATAVFRHKGEETVTWGSDFRQVASRRQPLEAGRSLLVVLKSDARYHSTGTPESMFGHKLFRDASVEFFLRVGSSGWASFGKADVERRIGAREVEGLAGASPSPGP
jgi:hypothetical protein